MKLSRLINPGNLFFSLPLRFKITVPYLIVAILLAGVATYQVGRTMLTSLEQRFQGQLSDAAARSADEIVTLEERHLTAVRGIAFTMGVAEAVEAGDIDKLESLVRPIIANEQVHLVEILDRYGAVLISMRLSEDGSEHLIVGNEAYQEWELVQRVRAGEIDKFGDKFSALQETPFGPVIYTAGPIRLGEQLRGVVLVGTPADVFLPQLGRTSIADVSLYDSEGISQLSTMSDRPLEPLGDEMLLQFSREGSYLPDRVIEIGSRSYVEALDRLILRAEPSNWYIGVSLPESMLMESPGKTWMQILAIFTVGILIMIGLGVLVAQLIAIPVFRLVTATNQVSRGEFDFRVEKFAEDELGYLTEGFNHMVAELQQRERMRELFGRMVSEEVREAVLQGKIELGGESRDVTVLFTDLRGFTSMSEAIPPQEIISVLNEYFAVIAEATKKHHGMINQFGGDSALVIFGAPIPCSQEESLKHAIMAAIDIRVGAAELNARRIVKGHSVLRFGIGINSGSAVAGNLGTQDRFSYTVIGDVVNVAARLQGLSREFPHSPILVTEDSIEPIRDQLQVDFMELGSFELKGKSNQVTIYTIFGPAVAGPLEFEQLIETGIPKVNAYIAAYLHCKEYPVDVISKTLQSTQTLVYEWLRVAHTYPELTGRILVDHFGLEREAAQSLFGPAPILDESQPVVHYALTY